MITLTSKAHEDTWMGLTKDGKPVQISHEDLMVWAYKNDMQFTIGWSHSATIQNGTRLVRGNHIEEARKAGWNDLADQLEAFFSGNDEQVRETTA